MELQRTTGIDTDIITSLVLEGDLSKMTPVRRTEYYKKFCEALGLNPLTQPFQILNLSGKVRMYATKDCTEQLRKIHGVSITSVTSQEIRGVFIATASAQDREGRTDSATGAVTIDRLVGDNLANALMKAETKAKRRVTLSICGLGMLDETELDTMPGAKTSDAVKIEGDNVVPLEQEAKKPEAPAADQEPTKQQDVQALHKEYTSLLNEYGAIAGMKKALSYHPDNWDTREAKNYHAAIREIRHRISKGKEAVHV